MLLQVATAIVPPEWVSGDGGYRPPIFTSFQGSTTTLLLSQALNADTPPQKGERRQTTANLSEAHWKDWKQVAGETSKGQFMRVAIM